MKQKHFQSSQILIIIIVAAIFFRVIAAIYLGNRIENQPAIYDEYSYNALAQRILQGKGYSFDEAWYPFTPADTPTAHWSYLYPLYLAVFYKFLGVQPLMPRLIQAILGGILICWLIYHIGKRLSGSSVGLVSAGIAAVYLYFIYYAAALMTETFYIILVLFIIDISLMLVEQATLSLWLALGMALGAAALLRQVFLVFVPVLFIWLAWAGKGKFRIVNLLIPAGAMAILILPWTIRNYVAYKSFLLLNSNAGYAFYTANHPHHGNNYDWRFLPDIPVELLALNEAQIDRALISKSLALITHDPIRFIALSLSRVDDYFHFLPSADSSTLSNISRMMSFSLFLPFMIYGLILSLREWKKYLLLYLFIVSYSLIHIVSWPGPRYRLPVDAVLILFAGLAITDLLSRIPKLSFLRSTPPPMQG